MLYQLALKNGAAIWIENETIFYLDTYFGIWFVKLPKRNIESVSIGPMGYFKQKGLIFHLRTGSQKSVRTWFLREPPDIVLSELKANISGTALP